MVDGCTTRWTHGMPTTNSLDATTRSAQGRRPMSQHEWSTYQRTDDKQHDECLRCDARRVRGTNSDWKWRYWRRSSETCTGKAEKGQK